MDCQLYLDPYFSLFLTELLGVVCAVHLMMFYIDILDKLGKKKNHHRISGLSRNNIQVLDSALY
jgi:hypothetical protein